MQDLVNYLREREQNFRQGKIHLELEEPLPTEFLNSLAQANYEHQNSLFGLVQLGK